MKPIVELISEWDSYQQAHPEATVASFCQHYLSAHTVTAPKATLFEGIKPPDLTTTFAKLIGRLGSILTNYLKMALKEDAGVELEWFYCMNFIFHQGEVRKIDVISYNFLEQTTGIDILNRLRQAGYMTERTDPADKRAKLVQLTDTGKQLLFRLYDRLYYPAYLLFSEVSNENKQLIMNLLGPVEIEHGKLLMLNRNRRFSELITDLLGAEEVAKIIAYQHHQITSFTNSKG